MNAISEYILCVFIASLVASAVEFVTPNNHLKKYVNIITSLFLLISLLMPFKELLNELAFYEDDFVIQESENILENNETYDEIIKSITSKIEKKIAEMLKEAYGIDSTSVKLTINSDDIESIIIEKIEIYVSIEYSEHFENIKGYIEQEFKTHTEIVAV